MKNQEIFDREKKIDSLEKKIDNYCSENYIPKDKILDAVEINRDKLSNFLKNNLLGIGGQFDIRALDNGELAGISFDRLAAALAKAGVIKIRKVKNDRRED